MIKIMDVLVDCVLRSLLVTRKDVFGENCAFVDFESDDANFDHFGYQSSARFGRLIYRRDDEKVKRSDHLILKVTPSTVLVEKFTLLAFFSEVVFYTRILTFFETINPEISRLFPRYYNSLLQYNLNSDEAVIVFENVQACGYTMAKKKSFLDYEHLRLAMKKLGQFHAHSYRAREEAPQKFHTFAFCMVESNGFVLKTFSSAPQCKWRGFEALSNDPHYTSKIEKVRDLVAVADEIFIDTLTKREHNHTHVLCHGDFVASNLLFKYENGKPIDLKMVDLANWRFGSPVIDLATILYINADQKMRDENWDNLIDEYYEAVRNTFPSVNVPSKDSILAEFKTQALLGYFIASFFLPNLITKDNGDVSRWYSLFNQNKDAIFSDAHKKELLEAMWNEGGEKATTALMNILKDIIDRGFV